MTKATRTQYAVRREASVGRGAISGPDVAVTTA
jgi:hypothetical protein